jgi:Flp pilus assembly protein TadG
LFWLQTGEAPRGASVTASQPSRSECGTTLVLITVFMMSLLGMAAMTIDVGSWYAAKRHVQADADAAALAGASNIPANVASANATANFNTNKLLGETLSVTTPTADTVSVTVTYLAPTYFAKLFGKSSVTITATSTAQIQAAGSVSHHVSPFAVLRSVYSNGQGTTMFTCSGSGTTSNCGTVDLPTAANTSGGSCSGAVYAGTSQDVSAAIDGTEDAGRLVLGGCLSPKPGATQGSATIADSLLGSFSQDLNTTGNNQYQVTPQPWDDPHGLPPRLIYVPIVDTFSQGTGGQWTITGFAWFYMTGSTGNGSSRTISGQYVSLAGPPTGGTTTTWVPNQVGQVTSVALTI